MRICRVKLAGYKNLNLEVFPGPGLNLIHAPNGSGKTNFLEAVNYLATGSSFRGVDDDYVFPISGGDLASAEIDLETNSKTRKLRLVWLRSGGKVSKKCFLDGRPTSSAKFRRLVATIVHAPTTIDIVADGAKLRRDFLDQALLQIRPYLQPTFRNYRRALLQKNKLLQQQTERAEFASQLNFWNQILLANGATITYERIQLLSALQPLWQEMASKIYALPDYLPGFLLNSRYFDYAGGGLNQELLAQLHEGLKAKLINSRDKEIFAHRALYGPHRDDFEFTLGGRNVRYATSRGQQRLFSLILHLALAKLLEAELDENLIYLLDDIFSELDPVHRHKTLAYLKANSRKSRQIFIALPEVAGLKLATTKAAPIVKLKLDSL